MSERHRRLPSITPDAKGIPWAKWAASQGQPQREAEQPAVPAQAEPVVFGAKPKQPKKGKDKAA